MAQVLRLICGKCGTTFKVVTEEEIKQKEGEVLEVTCGQACIVIASHRGCTNSKLILEKIKGEAEIKEGDMTLEELQNDSKAVEEVQTLVEKSTKAAAPHPKKKKARRKEEPVVEEEDEDEEN